jgi:hypothetical protein
MEQKFSSGIDVEIDKLTNSIENGITGDSLSTEISALNSTELKVISKRNKWLFNWKYEFDLPERDVYKLTIVHNAKIIQGLISLEIKQDHVYMHLLESAPFNKGKEKVYLGVPGNLVAFACKLSFQKGYNGNIAFTAKSKLIDHYTETLGAIHISGRIMIIESKAALKLITKYFKSQ